MKKNKHKMPLRAIPKSFNGLIFIFLMSLFFSFSDLSAQENPFVTAREMLQIGKVDSAISLLEKPYENKAFLSENIENQSEWLKLLSFCYIQHDRLSDAKNTIRRFVGLNPFYEKSSTDAPQFLDALDTIRARPTLMIGIRAGALMSDTHIIGEKRFIVDKVFGAQERIYRDGFGFIVGLQTMYFFYKNFALHFAPAFLQRKFNYETRQAAAVLQMGASLDTTYLSTFASQQFNYFHFPLSFKAQKDFKKFALNAQVGFSWESLWTAQKTLSASYTLTETDFDAKNIYAKHQQYLILGMGVIFPRKKLSYTVDLRYIHGIGNITQNPYFLDRAGLGYYDVADNIKFTSVELSLGIFYNLRFKADE